MKKSFKNVRSLNKDNCFWILLEKIYILIKGQWSSGYDCIVGCNRAIINACLTCTRSGVRSSPDPLYNSSVL